VTEENPMGDIATTQEGRERIVSSLAHHVCSFRYAVDRRTGAHIHFCEGCGSGWADNFGPGALPWRAAADDGSGINLTMREVFDMAITAGGEVERFDLGKEQLS
jgi:hypothetical protein